MGFVGLRWEYCLAVRTVQMLVASCSANVPSMHMMQRMGCFADLLDLMREDVVDRPGLSICLIATLSQSSPPYDQ